ncbi:HEAT repeat domain-containing protein [Myxacorys almedinensis]|uniref:HEAT repeat domain-containing protein n=1 Tax=Myxacorys almedinensis A TaxID=2690445 RepID=A0A8J7Z4Y5_9CYAN|nr:HEAT repeat domain-containing protein [Myxacorys almedinensis]NDJ18188.1 HEAT repeat domain-containing protein [Myxacorys almedinensis A]
MIATDPAIEPLITAIAQADSPATLIGAVRALAQTASLSAIPTLIEVLGYNNPGAASVAVAGLVQMGEAAVPLLLEQIDDYNYGARASSLRALAAIADPRAFEVLLEAAATDFAPSVRRAAIKGLGTLRWQPRDLDGQPSIHDRTVSTLLLVSHDSDWTIRYAAIAAFQSWIFTLQNCSETTDLTRQALERLEHLRQTDEDEVVRARASMAQHQLTIVPYAQ